MYVNRVQPGYCFHLFTQLRAQSLDDYQLPEMLRTPLEELCLQIKVQFLFILERVKYHFVPF